MQEKVCTKCGALKPISDYYKKKTGIDGLHSWCKACVSSYRASWWKENKEAQTKRINAWRADNPDRIREYARRWQSKNPEKVKAKTDRWKANNPDGYRDKERRSYHKRRSTVRGRIEDSIRANVIRGITRQAKRSRKTFDLLGYTAEDLRIHLERLFKPGMSWSNYGRGGWEIDHVIPLAAHNYQGPDDIDFKKAWSLSNLQPLWGDQNKRKSDKLVAPFQPSLSIPDTGLTTDK